MAGTTDKPFNSPPPKTHKLYFITQICLRVLALIVTLSAAYLMFTNKQATTIYGIPADARYSYSSAFKFFAFANSIAFVFSVLSLFLAFFTGKMAVNPTYHFCLFIHDLVITVLLMAGCAAATAIGFLGKYGNSHTGWMAICDHFAKFCNKATTAALLSYLGFAFFLILTIVSAKKSQQIQV